MMRYLWNSTVLVEMFRIEAMAFGASWQRCRTHLMSNLLCKVSNKAQPAMGTLVRSVLPQTDQEEAIRQYGYLVQRLSPQLP